MFAGGLTALGQAPFGLTLVSLFGLGVGIWTVSEARAWRSAAAFGWAFGFGYFLVCLHWIVEPFLVDPVRHGWMAPFALVLLPGGLALFWGTAGALATRLRPGAARRLGFAAALALAEVARGYVLTGFPWALLGSIWLDTAVAQSARFLGLHGLSALTVMTIACTLALWSALEGPRRSLAAVPLVGVFGALFVYGLPHTAPVPAPSDAPLVRLVQPNAAQDLKWDPEFVQVFYERQLTLSTGEIQADLIVWPETAISQPLGSASSLLEQISRFTQGRPVILGANRWRLDGPANALAVIGPRGEIEALYDKAHLVPFGEYVPLGNVAARLGIRGLAAREGGGFAPGPGPQLLDMGRLGIALPLICYEAIFPQFGRTLSQRADWMVQITNDAWFGRFAGPQQHLAIARFRSIERGLPLIRVANTGVSAMIDARGRVLEALPLNTTGALDAALPSRLSVPPHARWGDTPTVLILIVLFSSLLILRRGSSD